MSKKKKDNLLLDAMNAQTDNDVQEAETQEPMKESVLMEDEPRLMSPEFSDQVEQDVSPVKSLPPMEDHFAFPPKDDAERGSLPDYSNKKPVISPMTDFIVGQKVRLVRDTNGELKDHWGKPLFLGLLEFDLVVVSVWTNKAVITVKVPGHYTDYAVNAENVVAI